MIKRVKHKKRGGTYEVVGYGEIQTDTPLGDYAKVVVYRDETAGHIWIRPVSEFGDGRFEELPSEVS
jgi:hypothetical protein